MDILKKASKIKEEATRFLQEKQIESRLRAYGELYYTGSYALDLMTWKDIDLHLVLRPELNPLQTFGAFLVEMTKDPDFIKAQIIHFKGNYKPQLPRGVAFGALLNFHDSGPWKIDLWSLGKTDFEQNHRLIEEYRKNLTPETRELILHCKEELMQKTGRVPQMGSHFLYQAILIHHLRDRTSIYEYLTKNGVEI